MSKSMLKSQMKKEYCKSSNFIQFVEH